MVIDGALNFNFTSDLGIYDLATGDVNYLFSSYRLGVGSVALDERGRIFLDAAYL